MRRTLFVLGSLLALALLVLVTMPWWLGSPLAVVGKKYGLTYARYQRIGYGRFALTDVRVERAGVEVRAARVEGEAPLLWLWRRHGENAGEWAVSRWSVDVTPRNSPSGPPTVVGWITLRSVLDRVFVGLRSWLPPTTVGPGRVTWPGGQVDIAGAVWKADHVRISEVSFRDWRASADLHWPEDGVKSVALRPENATWSLAAKSPDAAVLEVEAHVLDQVGSVRGTFGPTGWLPNEATAHATAWTLPANEVRLSPAYETVSGSLDLNWKESALSFSLDAEATPAAGSSAPPLVSEVRGSGDATHVRVERLAISGPGVQATLAQPVAIERGGTLNTPETTFQVEADLARMPWFDAQGSVRGSVQVERDPNGKVRLAGTLSGEKLEGKSWSLPGVRIEAGLAWPLLTVSSGEVTAAEEERVFFNGSYDLKEMVLGQTHVMGAVSKATVSRWVPDKLDFERVQFSCEVAGAWTALQHRGQLTVSRPAYGSVATTSLEIRWQGAGEKLAEISGTWVAGATQIDFSGDADRQSARVKSLRVMRDGAESLKSTIPASVAWSPSLRIETLRLDGAGGTVGADFSGGAEGHVELTLKEVSPKLWRDFLPMTGPSWVLHSARVSGAWDRGPVVFSLQGTGTVELEQKQSADIVVVAKGDRTGFELSQLDVAVGENRIVTATGKIPATVTLFPTWAVKIDRTADLKVDLATEKDSFFWSRVGELTGLSLVDPQIHVNLFGTWRAPRGEATLEIKRVGWPKKAGGESLPPLDMFRARLVGDGKNLSLEEFSTTVAGQPVVAEARLPLPEEITQTGVEEVKKWIESHLEARVRLTDADLAAVAPYAQAWIAPTGRLSLDLSLKPDLRWEGSLQLRDAASRPLGPLGVLQGIEADLVLKGRTLEVKRLEAKTGGQPVTVTGSAELTDEKGWNLDLSMTGANLPLVRQTGFLVRGDIDLRAKTGSTGATQVTGKATLRDSLFLADLRTFIPRGSLRSSPSRRPPYFSIEAEPFARWQLAVQVEGSRFLRLRTPVFSGVASARFRLQGTLLEPMAIGELMIDEGQVTLPFATLQAQQGNVSLTEVDPYDPRISLIAVSRRLGYDLKLELSGSASSPNLVFSSSPPLGSEQVLRLVMAGEAPQKEVIYSGQQRAMRLGAYLGQSLAGQIGADTSRAERFSLTVGERVSREGRETYSLEFPIDERFSLIGEYDEFDDYNVGVKWRAFRDRSKDPVAEKKGDAGSKETKTIEEKPTP